MKNILLLIAILGIALTTKAQITESPNGNVGIGTTTPSSNLEIQTDTPTTGLYEVQKWTNTHRSDYNLTLKTNWDIHGINHSFVHKYNGTDYNSLSFFAGNVGIGNVNPESKLHVRGDDLGELVNDQSILTTIDGKVGNVSKFQILNKRNQDGDNWNHTSLRLQRVIDFTPMAFIDFGIEDETQSYGLAFGTRDGFSGTQEVRMVIDGNGDVGIGTKDPQGYKLAVAGKVIAEEVKVELQSNWPDYVFEEDYELPSLQETENYIKQKGHLKDIPAAEEVQANGIDLGAMNAKLLRKIEELTLYTIDQERKLNAQNSKIERLDIENTKLLSFNRKLLEFQSRLEKLESEK